MEEILLIDDDVALCSMLTEYLGKNGFRVTGVHRGDSGLKTALQRPWPLILDPLFAVQLRLAVNRVIERDASEV